MTARDDGESVSLFEPLVVSEGARSRSRLNDLALSLAEKSAALSSSTPSAIANSVADLVRIADCHYCGLLEGHFIHPIDIERAIKGDLSDDVERRALQLEAGAHIKVQRWIDDGGVDATPFSSAVIREIHRRLWGLPPENSLVDTVSCGPKLSAAPGAFRTTDVHLGQRVAVSPGAVPRFLARMEERYKHVGRIDRILNVACAHHRLLWVHPFTNRSRLVASLFSHAGLRSSLTTAGLWSVARGLARREMDYRAHLHSCDEQCRGNLIGHESVGEGALADFVEFFLTACVDQVDCMSDLLEPRKFRDHVLTWARQEMRAGSLPPRSDSALTAILYRGELQRRELVSILGISDRSVRRLTAALIKTGVVQSETERSRLQLALPICLAMRSLPGFFAVN